MFTALCSLLNQPLQIFDAVSPTPFNQFVFLIELNAWSRLKQGLTVTCATGSSQLAVA